MPEKILKIISLGLIGDTSGGDSFRYIACEDKENGIYAEFMISKRKKPALWKTFLDIEEGKLPEFIEGSISQTDKKTYVVVDNDKFESVSVKQREKRDTSLKISRREAEEMRKRTKGYRTDLTVGNALETGWCEIDRKAKKISFRNYNGNGKFSWDCWYEITE